MAEEKVDRVQPVRDNLLIEIQEAKHDSKIILPNTHFQRVRLARIESLGEDAEEEGYKKDDLIVISQWVGTEFDLINLNIRSENWRIIATGQVLAKLKKEEKE